MESLQDNKQTCASPVRNGSLDADYIRKALATALSEASDSRQ